MKSPLLRLVLIAWLGVAALWRGVIWYNDYLSRREATRFREAIEASRPPPGADPARRVDVLLPPEPPTDEELQMLRSSDLAALTRGVGAVMKRQMTETAMTAVEQALEVAATEAHRARLGCLKARYPGPEGLDYAIAHLPVQEKAFVWSLPPEVECLLRTVSDRAAENPVGARDALLRAVYSGNPDVRSMALRGLERIKLDDFPIALQLELQSRNYGRRQNALRAALALGAVRLLPGLVERALGDDELHDIARVHLQMSPEPSAARLAARVVAADSSDPYMKLLFDRREQKYHDVSAGLAEIALNLDETAEPTQRAAALGVLEQWGDVGVIPLIAPLRSSAEEPVRKAADQALAKLEKRRALGIPSNLRRLDQPARQ